MSRMARSTIRSSLTTCRTIFFDPNSSAARRTYFEKFRAPTGWKRFRSRLVKILVAWPSAMACSPIRFVVLMLRLALRHCRAKDGSWWPEWSEWLVARSNGWIAPPATCKTTHWGGRNLIPRIKFYPALLPCSRQISAIGTPPSAWRRIARIWGSLYLVIFI